MKISLEEYKKYFRLLVAASLVWGVAGTWWYVCKIQYLCEDTASSATEVTPVATVAEQKQVVQAETPLVEVVPSEPAPSKRLLFQPDSAEPLEEYAAYFDQVAGYMAKYAEKMATATGYTADLPSEVTLDSLELASARSAYVKQQLVARGVGGSRISTQAKGTEEPVADPNTEEGAVQNRRVELEIK
jgi:outer membrane protein OmpA-like peptidoglycan-associated protein